MTRSSSRLLLPVATFLTVACSEPASRDLRASDGLLGALAGSWTLTGSMGAVALRQNVDAKWVVQGRFLKMHFTQDTPAAPETPYEAIYMLSYDSTTAKYLLHLFDTFGPGYSRTIGVGTRRGDSVEFLFEYPSGLFSNTFVRHAQKDVWEMILRQRDARGQWKTFATKTLVRNRRARMPQ